MILGIDYGTTRTVVAAVDRGNYPVVSFQSDSGDAVEWYPSLVAARARERAFGLAAAARQNEPGWTLLRSFKRGLATLGPESMIALGDESISAVELLTEFLAQLRRDLIERSNLRISPREEMEAVISVPANSNSNQRFITIESFRRAGFQIRGMINEPSAAGIEYAHRHLNASAPLRKEYTVIYDFGGGTFDASVIGMADRRHEVVSSEGIGRLGGDDFDEILLDLALEEAAIKDLADDARAALLEECREKKEGLHPNTRKIAIDLGRAIEGAGEIVVSTQDFYERCRPLVERTIEATESSVRQAPEVELDWSSVAALYMVGGSSELPVVARLLRERFGRLVRKSPYPHAATAIGLAIAADHEAGYELRERFTRHFGVWREAEDGQAISFDILFEKETPLPLDKGASLARSRLYRPAHNLGHFRYLECSQVSRDGQPTGDITLWDEVFFPFDPQLEGLIELKDVAVARADVGQAMIEEVYECDAQGIIKVDILNHATGARRSYRLRATKSGEAK